MGLLRPYIVYVATKQILGILNSVPLTWGMMSKRISSQFARHISCEWERGLCFVIQIVFCFGNGSIVYIAPVIETDPS